MSGEAGLVVVSGEKVSLLFQERRSRCRVRRGVGVLCAVSVPASRYLRNFANRACVAGYASYIPAAAQIGAHMSVELSASCRLPLAPAGEVDCCLVDPLPRVSSVVKVPHAYPTVPKTLRDEGVLQHVVNGNQHRPRVFRMAKPVCRLPANRKWRYAVAVAVKEQPVV